MLSVGLDLVTISLRQGAVAGGLGMSLSGLSVAKNAIDGAVIGGISASGGEEPYDLIITNINVTSLPSAMTLAGMTIPANASDADVIGVLSTSGGTSPYTYEITDTTVS